MSFAKEVWQTFSGYNVKPLVEKNGQVEYITWAKIWTVVMQLYPDSYYEFDDRYCGDSSTVEVTCTLTVVGQDEGGEECAITRSMHLPVMQSHVPFNSIENPTSREISDSRMRCLVKCAAIHGLGLTLWSGEDHLQRENPQDKTVEYAKLPPDYRLGLAQAALVVKEAFDTEDPSAAVEAYVELDEDEKMWFLLAKTKGGFLEPGEKTWLREQYFLAHKSEEG